MMTCLAPVLWRATPGSVNDSFSHSSRCRLDFGGGISVCYDHNMIPRRQNDGAELWQAMEGREEVMMERKVVYMEQRPMGGREIRFYADALGRLM